VYELDVHSFSTGIRECTSNHARERVLVCTFRRDLDQDEVAVGDNACGSQLSRVPAYGGLCKADRRVLTNDVIARLGFAFLAFTGAPVYGAVGNRSRVTGNTSGGIQS
jgi:hypothetical protein